MKPVIFQAKWEKHDGASYHILKWHTPGDGIYEIYKKSSNDLGWKKILDLKLDSNIIEERLDPTESWSTTSWVYNNAAIEPITGETLQILSGEVSAISDLDYHYKIDFQSFELTESKI